MLSQLNEGSYQFNALDCYEFKDAIISLWTSQDYLPIKLKFTFCVHGVNTRNPQCFDFTTTHESEFWNRFQDQEGEDVPVYGKQHSDDSHQIVTFTTKRIWKDKETTTTIQLRFTPYDQLMTLLTQKGFEINQVYGDDKKAPFQKGSPLIIPLCTLKTS